MKRLSRLKIKDITATKQRLAVREITEAQLKLVSGGGEAETGKSTCSTCGCDCDDA